MNVIKYINQAISVNEIFTIIFDVKTDCIKNPETKAIDKRNKPNPNILKFNLYIFSIGKGKL